MALSDPQKFKEESETEVEAPRVSTGDFKSIYQTSDGNHLLTVSTTKSNSNRKRHLVRIDATKLATNPYDEETKETVSTSVYLVVDRPVNGFTVEECMKLVKGLVGLLSASTYSLTTKVLGGES
jgi:hypothetical protein